MRTDTGWTDAVRETVWSRPARSPSEAIELPIRPRSGRVLLGVCAGIARVLGWPAWAVRVVVVVLSGSFATVPIYLLAYVLMPAERGSAWPRIAVAGAALGGGGVGIGFLVAADLHAIGVPVVVAVLLGAGSGAAVPVLVWWPLLAWRWLTVVVLLTLVAAGRWGDAPWFATHWPVPLGMSAVALMAMFGVALRHDRPVAVTAGVLTVLVDVVPMTLLTASPPPVLLTSALVVAVVLVLGDVIRTQRRTGHRLAAARRQDLARQAVLEERARIARELHDVVAHHMSMIAIQAEAAPYKVAELPEPLGATLQAIQAAARDALVETRRIVALLRVDEDGEREPQPGLERLDELVGRARGAGLDVTASIVGIPVLLPIGVDLSAYRIVQEALSNAARHAPGARTAVTVTYGAALLTVRISDDGTGAGTPGGGHGLVGMRERVAMLGGRLTAGPGAAGGYTVVAELPIGNG